MEILAENQNSKDLYIIIKEKNISGNQRKSVAEELRIF